MVSKIITFLRELGKKFLKIQMEAQKTQVARTVLSRKTSTGSITISDVKLYHRAREIKVTVQF